MDNEIKSGKVTIKKQRTPMESFARTFLIAFIIFVVLGTPVFAMLGKVADINIGGSENGSLEENLPDYC